MGARRGRKLKAVSYMLTGLLCLLAGSLERLGYFDLAPVLQNAAVVFFILSMIMAVLSFIDYFMLYLKTGKN
jgi:phosphatidylglycerophosphate synthase